MFGLAEGGEVRLVVSTMGRDHSVATVESPSLDDVTDALCDLYVRMGCEACGREAKAVVTLRGVEYDLHSQDPEAAPEEVATELWGKLVALCGEEAGAVT